jgi:hypothetical protein
MNNYTPFPLSGNFAQPGQYQPFPMAGSAGSTPVAPYGSPLLADTPYSPLNYFGNASTNNPVASWNSGYDLGMGNTAGVGMPSVTGGGFLDRFKGWMGDSNNPGPLGVGLKTAGGLASLFMGMKQYGLAKKQIGENTRQFDLNYDAQRRTTNARLEDRQRARVASNPNEYVSVGDYMQKNGIR